MVDAAYRQRLLGSVLNIDSKERNEPQIVSVVDLNSDEELYVNPNELSEEDVKDVGTMEVESGAYKGPLLMNTPLPNFEKLEGPLTCSLCLGILRQTHATRCCLTRMCKGCLVSLIKTVNKDARHPCPHCRMQISSMRSTRPDERIDDLISVFMSTRSDDNMYADKKAFEDEMRRAIREGKEKHKARARKMLEESNKKQKLSVNIGEKVAGGAGVRRKGKPKISRSARALPVFPSGLEAERTVHLALKPLIEVFTGAREVRHYEDHIECGSSLLPGLKDEARPTNTLADVPTTSDGGDIKSLADILEWRQHISQVTAGRVLPYPYLTASSLLSLGDLRSYLTAKKQDLDNDFAQDCYIKGVQSDVLDDCCQLFSSGESASVFADTSEICGTSIESPFVFDFEFYMLFDEVPMKLDYDLRLVDVVRSLWDVTVPLELFFRSVGKASPQSV